MEPEWADLIRETFLRAGLRPDGFGNGWIDRAIFYLREVSRCRRTHRLTAITDATELVRTFLLRPFRVFNAVGVRFLPDRWVYDIGSGGGVPGIGLKLAGLPSNLVLIDRAVRKTAFLERVVKRLDLQNTAVRTIDALRIEPCRGDWVLSQGVDLGSKPLRRRIRRWLARGVSIGWITHEAKTTLFNPSPDRHRITRWADDPLVFAAWI